MAPNLNKNSFEKKGYSPIDDERMDYYLQKEKQRYPKCYIKIQKHLLQTFLILSAIASLYTLDAKHSQDEKLALMSLFGGVLVASLREKRQNLEQKIDVFSTASEEFITKEVLNSEAKTLSFVSGEKYKHRFEAIRQHQKTKHRIQLLTSVLNTGILSGFFFNQLEVGETLLGLTTTLMGGNLAEYINAKHQIKKISQTLPQNVASSFFHIQRIKD